MASTDKDVAEDKSVKDGVKVDDIPDAKKAKELDKKEAKPDAAPKSYTAPHDVYVSHQFRKAGDVFVTNAKKEDTWIEHSPEDANAINASQQKVPADVNFDSMDDAALQGFAATKHVDTTGMDHDQMVAAIKAANEPKL